MILNKIQKTTNSLVEKNNLNNHNNFSVFLEQKREKEDISNTNSGYEKRNVIYEDIHNTSQEYFDLLNSLCNLEQQMKVLDVGCGYGSVSFNLYERNKGKDIAYYLLDNSKLQLSRAESLNKTISNIHFLYSCMSTIPTPDDYFDRIIVKMSLHEIPFKFQKRAITEFKRVLNKEGILIVWDLDVPIITQEIFHKIVMKKDQLAGFTDLVHNRYFFTIEELYENLFGLNFKDFGIKHKINQSMNTYKRLNTEFGNNMGSLLEWNEYIRKIGKDQFPFIDKGESIEFNINQFILTAQL